LSEPRIGVRGEFQDKVLLWGHGSLVPYGSELDDAGFSIPGPAVVNLLEENRPIRGGFYFSLVRIRVLLPKPQMAEDALAA